MTNKNKRKFILSDNGTCIIKTNIKPKGKLEIPYGIKVIGKESFSDCPSITEVVLPESVERIEDSAFEFCYLPELVVPDSVNYIGQYAFEPHDNHLFINRTYIPLVK